MYIVCSLDSFRKEIVKTPVSSLNQKSQDVILYY